MKICYSGESSNFTFETSLKEGNFNWFKKNLF